MLQSDRGKNVDTMHFYSRILLICWNGADCDTVHKCTAHPEVDLNVAVEWVVVDVQRQSELSLFLDMRSLKKSQTVGVQLPPDCSKRDKKSSNEHIL